MSRSLFGRLFRGDRTSDRKEEISDGVFESRRRMLFALPAAIAIPVLGVSAASRKGLVTRIDWDEFLKQCLPRATELHGDGSSSGQDAYLFWLASMAAKLDPSTMPKGKLEPFAKLEPPVTVGPAYFGKPFFIIEWEMAPNAYLPPHNHPNGSVCTVCTDGDARIRNFQPEGDTPEFKSSQVFRVRETQNELLTAGRINNLSAVRDNIHTFKAGKKGARGFDISTYHGKDIGFSFIDIREKPVDTRELIFEATWTALA